MTKLLEIEAAAEALPPEQQLELFRFLAAHLRSALPQPQQKARLVRQRGDALLEAPTGAPPMTPQT